MCVLKISLEKAKMKEKTGWRPHSETVRRRQPLLTFNSESDGWRDASTAYSGSNSSKAISNALRASGITCPTKYANNWTEKTFWISYIACQMERKSCLILQNAKATKTILLTCVSVYKSPNR